jgi:hypothetical protein
MTKAFPKEADVKAKVKLLLDKHGWMWWMTPGSVFGKSGVSDFCAFKHGTFMAIETKLHPNKPTEQQKAFLRSVRAEGGVAFVVSDRTMDIFKGWFDEITDTIELTKPYV